MDGPPDGEFGLNLGGFHPDSYHREALLTMLVRQLLNVIMLSRVISQFDAFLVWVGKEK